MKKQGWLNSEKAPLNEKDRTRKVRTLAHTDSLIEHLEEEMEPLEFDEDLELLLKNSAEDRALFESLKQTRKLVKSSDNVALPESGAFYEDLHAKIMSAIENEEVINGTGGGSVRASKRVAKPIAWPQIFGAIGMTMMLAIVALMSLKSSNLETKPVAQEVAQSADQADANFERRLAMVNPRTGAQVAHELGSFESEEDFLTETAAARLKQISAGEARAMLYNLGH